MVSGEGSNFLESKDFDIGVISICLFANINASKPYFIISIC